MLSIELVGYIGLKNVMELYTHDFVPPHCLCQADIKLQIQCKSKKKVNENLGVLIGLKSVAGIDTYNFYKYECRIHFKLD